MSTFAPPRKTKSGTPNQSTVAGVFRRFRLSRQKIALCNQKTRSDRDWHSSLQHTQPWLPSSPLSLSSRPASPRPRRAPRAPSAPPPSTVSRSRSPRYARAVGPCRGKTPLHGACDIFHLLISHRRARRGPRSRPRDEIQPAARAGGTRGIPSWRSRSGDPVSRLEGPTTGPDPDRSRSGVAALSPDVSRGVRGNTDELRIFF